MPLIGTQAVTLDRDSGEFPCPTCGYVSLFLHKSVRRFLTVFGVPLVPMNWLGEFVECQGCGHPFAMELIGFDPGPRLRRERREFARHVVWVMVLVGLNDGELDEAERTTIRDVHEKLAGVSLPDEEIAREMELALRSSVGPADYVRRFVEAFRGHGRAELTFRAALRVARADGRIGEPRRSALLTLAEALEIPRRDAQDLLGGGAGPA